jgi:type IX secretion system PorP/SprF family membrane protein
MKKIRLILFYAACVLFPRLLSAQIDPHFSQYYAYPLWLNPALTGVMNGDARINANYRNQWASVSSNPYSTTSISADIRPTTKISLGLNVIDQKAGSSGFNYFAGYGSASYGIIISNDSYQHINFGLQAGLINRSFDLNKFQFGNQYDPMMGFNPGLPSLENFTSSNTTVFDANAGVFYYDANPLKIANLFGGFSVNHLAPAKDPFATVANSRIPLRYDVHGGVRIQASEYFSIIPHAIYIQQQQNKILAFGAYTQLQFNDGNELILGGMFRKNDAAVANVGYHFKNMLIGMSYDVNSSSLTRATQGQGGLELSLSYVFRKRIQEPEEVCPRL